MIETKVQIQQNGLIRQLSNGRIIGITIDVEKESHKPHTFDSQVDIERSAQLEIRLEGNDGTNDQEISHCKCGMAYVIERDVKGSDRPDRKRVYPVGKRENVYNSYVCRQCGSHIPESVPGAEYEEQVS